MPAVKKGGAQKKAPPRTATRPSRGKAGRAPQGRGGVFSPRTAMWAATGVLGLALLGLLATGGRAQALGERVQHAIDGRFGEAGFRVASVQVAGASHFSIPYILSAAAVKPGEPILAVDLEQVRERVERVGWVRSVKVVRLLPDVVQIAVTERPRLAVWQHRGKLGVIDPDGLVIPEANPALFADLPLVVGDGGNLAAGTILPLVESRPRLMSRVAALVRVDSRRWDLKLKDGALVQLPAEGEDTALTQLDTIEQRGRVLELGFERIDLRDPEFVAVRPKNAGPLPPPATVVAEAKPAAPAAPAAAAEADAAKTTGTHQGVPAH
jgi:cell division protein FtsQ